ncbi:MAG: alpha/beta hydrolase [Lentisphaeria bacterium]|nr:alpha/beta hydrolase [Lentisphaeria bacterium]
MGTTIRDIAYAPEHGFRGQGDLHLPEAPAGAPVLFVIHGGGWQSMDRFRFDAVCGGFALIGYTCFNINYRLTGEAPWPACGDDCLRAARFALEAEHDAFAPLDRRRLIILGASAGGHLALMTGLRLPPDRVAGIVDIAGPTDLRFLWVQRGPGRFRSFFGTEEVSADQLAAASPVCQVTDRSPPLLCVHSTNDRLVPLDQSERIAAAYREVGRPCEVFSFAGTGEAHGIWDDQGARSPRLIGPIMERVAAFLDACRWAGGCRHH